LKIISSSFEIEVYESLALDLRRCIVGCRIVLYEISSILAIFMSVVGVFVMVVVSSDAIIFIIDLFNYLSGENIIVEE
jgi:hypothetical protein